MNGKRNALSDPEPLTILVAIASIVAGVESSINLYDRFWSHTPERSRLKIRGHLTLVRDNLIRLSAELEVLEATLEDAEIVYSMPFRLTSRAFLRSDQFESYRKAAEGMVERIPILVKALHGIASEMAYVPEMTSLPQIDVTDKRLQRVLRDDDITIQQAVRDLRDSLKSLHSVVERVSKESSG